MTTSDSPDSTKIEAFDCNSCPSAYMTQSGLDFHTDKQHPVMKDINNNEIEELSKSKQIKSDFKCTKCSMLYLSKAGLDRHIEKEHKDESNIDTKSDSDEKKEATKRKKVDQEKSESKNDKKELKMDDTTIGFKSTKPPTSKSENKKESEIKSKKMTRNEIKAKMSRNKGSEKLDIEELEEEKPKKETRSRTKKETSKKSSKKENEVEEMEVDEVKKKPSRTESKKTVTKTKEVSRTESKKTATKTKDLKNQKTSRPTGFNCKKCDVQFITSGGLDAHNKKKHEKEKEKKQPPKPPKEEKEEKVEQPDDGGVHWPPQTGAIVATLFEDDFYLGKVLKVSGKKTVKVQYMERHKKVPKETKDQYWYMPEKPDPPVQTDRESILGVNAIIQKDEKYSTKQITVYSLNNHQTWTRLGKSSRIGL